MMRVGKSSATRLLGIAALIGVATMGFAPPLRAAPTAAERVYPAVAHVGWVVGDIDLAIRNAQAQFGIASSNVVLRMTLPIVGATYQGRKVDYTIELCLVEMGNTQLEFIRPVRGTSPYADVLRAHPEGVAHHLAFSVPSIDQRLAQARAANPRVRVVLDAAIGPSARYVYVSGIVPGILVEFIQTGPGH